MSHSKSRLSAEEIINLFKEKKYEEIIEKNYSYYEKNKIQVNTEVSFCNDFISLKYLCFASYLAGYYYDCLVFTKKLFAIIPLSETIYDSMDRIYFIECILESTWFCLINELTSDEWDNEEWLRDALESAPAYYDKCSQNKRELFYNVKTIYEQYKCGILPYYKIEFFIPYTLNFNTYDFDLNSAYPYRKMLVCHEDRGTVAGTKFSVEITGFVKADSWWHGPKWNERQSQIVALPALIMVNRLLIIISECDTQEFVPRIRSEQLSSIDVSQYNGDGGLYRLCVGTSFNAQFITSWLNRPAYEDDELNRINQLLVQSYNYPLYATLFHRAQNTMYAGLYEESIMLFYSCIEATVQYWCEILATQHGFSKEYLDFIKKKPVCCNCSLYKREPTAEGVNKSELPPTIRHFPTFLKRLGIVTPAQERQLNSLIVKAQNDTLRNELIHGKKESINLNQLKSCQNSIRQLNELFLSIESNNSNASST